MRTKRTSAEPVAPLTDPRMAWLDPTPMLASARGLITVTDAPVSSMRLAWLPPLTLAETMMGLPGVNGIRVVFPAAASGDDGLARGAVGRSGNSIIWAAERKRAGTLSRPCV